MRPIRRTAVIGLLVLLVAWAAPAAAAPPPTPELSAKSAIVINAANGEVLYAQAAHRKRAIASTTKLMTALLTLDSVSLRDQFAAPVYRASPAEVTIGLQPGERMTVRDLMRALLLPSANDAAATLAQGVAGSRARFVRMMNRRARQLGLSDTHYSNPVGLDVGRNYSSAADLVTLARRLRRDAFFRHTTNLVQARLRSGNHPRTVVNRDDLVAKYRFINGVKTGHTNKAGYVLVGSGTKNGVTVISAVLGDPTEGARDADTLDAPRLRAVPAQARDRRAQGRAPGHGQGALPRERDHPARRRPHGARGRAPRPAPARRRARARRRRRSQGGRGAGRAPRSSRSRAARSGEHRS